MLSCTLCSVSGKKTDTHYLLSEMENTLGVSVFRDTTPASLMFQDPAGSGLLPASLQGLGTATSKHSIISSSSQTITEKECEQGQGESSVVSVCRWTALVNRHVTH